LFEGSEEGTDAEAFTIVGVVGSVKQAGLTDEEAQGAVYYPYVFRTDNNIFVAARTALTPSSLALTLQKVVREIDPVGPRSRLHRLSDGRISDRCWGLLSAGAEDGFWRESRWAARDRVRVSSLWGAC
jgi:hypothetical protein